MKTKHFPFILLFSLADETYFQRLTAKSWSSEDCLFLCANRLYKVEKLRLRLKENAKNQSSKKKIKEESNETKRERIRSLHLLFECYFCHCQSIVSKCFVLFFLRAWNYLRSQRYWKVLEAWRGAEINRLNLNLSCEEMAKIWFDRG